MRTLTAIVWRALRLDVPAVAPSVLSNSPNTHREAHTHAHTACDHMSPILISWRWNCRCKLLQVAHKNGQTAKALRGSTNCVCVCFFPMCVCLWCALRCSHFYFHVDSHSLSICRTLNSHILVAQVVKALTGGATAAPTSCVAGSLIPSPNDSITLGATLASRKQTKQSHWRRHQIICNWFCLSANCPRSTCTSPRY